MDRCLPKRRNHRGALAPCPSRSYRGQSISPLLKMSIKHHIERFKGFKLARLDRYDRVATISLTVAQRRTFSRRQEERALKVRLFLERGSFCLKKGADET